MLGASADRGICRGIFICLCRPSGICHLTDADRWIPVVPISPCKLVSLSYEVQQVFAKGAGVERVFFPERRIELPNRPTLTFAILALEQVFEDRDETWRMVESMTKKHGASARTFKSALIWCVPDVDNASRNEVRRVLAREDIQDEADYLGFDESQKRELPENVRRAQQDLRENFTIPKSWGCALEPAQE
jgi:hypothetical protein